MTFNFLNHVGNDIDIDWNPGYDLHECIRKCKEREDCLYLTFNAASACAFKGANGKVEWTWRQGEPHKSGTFSSLKDCECPNDDNYCKSRNLFVIVKLLDQQICIFYPTGLNRNTNLPGKQKKLQFGKKWIIPMDYFI